jgi:hypothetical protein
MVNATLGMGHQADPAYCGAWGRRLTARIDSQRYDNRCRYHSSFNDNDSLLESHGANFSGLNSCGNDAGAVNSCDDLSGLLGRSGVSKCCRSDGGFKNMYDTIPHHQMETVSVVDPCGAPPVQSAATFNTTMSASPNING